jgi:hypothetical protein
MAIWGCGSPACCCQPAVAEGVIYADLRSELSTHLALQALFTQSSPVCKPLLQAFPFPSTLGEVTLHPFSQACVFIYSSHGKCSSPLPCGVFSPPPLLQPFPLLVTGHVLPLLPSPAGLWGISPPPLFGAPGTPPSLLRVFFFVIAYYSVFLFSLGVGLSVQGAMLIWPRVVCRGTTYRLAHLVVYVFPSHLGTAVWQWCGSPPDFSV